MILWVAVSDNYLEDVLDLRPRYHSCVTVEAVMFDVDFDHILTSHRRTAGHLSEDFVQGSE